MRHIRGASREVWLLVGSIAGFMAITAWWLTQDDRVQDWDNGLHTIDAFLIHKELAAGHLTTWFTEFNMYPPLGHVFGALGVFVGGFSAASVILTSNLVFVPLLAVSCFGVGRLVYRSDLAGLLAALFALGTPMIVSEFHEFLLDPQQAAIVAASVWAILQLHPEITGRSRVQLLGVMRKLRREDAALIQFDPASANALFFNYPGLTRLAALAGLPVQNPYAPQQLVAGDAFLQRKPITAGGPPPCERFPDGTGLFVVRGDPLAPSPRYQCPAHSHA